MLDEHPPVLFLDYQNLQSLPVTPDGSVEVVYWRGSGLRQVPPDVILLLRNGLKELTLDGNDILELPCRPDLVDSANAESHLARLELGQNRISTLPTWMGDFFRLKRIIIY